jgi:hypothetical protein
MKTPTPKKGAGKSIVKCGRSKGSICITTPEKGKISRHFQSLGGESVRGAALRQQGNLICNPSSSGAGMVKKYDREIRDGVASRVNRRSTGRPKQFNADIEAKIIDAWADDDTRTYREVAKDLRHTTFHVAYMGGATRTASYKRLRPMGGATKRARGEVAPSASMWMHRTRRCVRG